MPFLFSYLEGFTVYTIENMKFYLNVQFEMTKKSNKLNFSVPINSFFFLYKPTLIILRSSSVLCDSQRGEFPAMPNLKKLVIHQGSSHNLEMKILFKVIIYLFFSIYNMKSYMMPLSPLILVSSGTSQTV